jgi:thiamine pyrophosphokinase
MSKRVVIIAGGDMSDYSWHCDYIVDDDFVICANGGSIHALKMEICPDLVIGDLDSLPHPEKEKLLSSGARVIEYPAAKDKSDLELALDYALETKPGEIVIVGALGGSRIDQLFINLLLLKIPLDKSIPALIIDHRTEIRLFNRSFKLNGKAGDNLSLFALTPSVEGVLTKGLKYPLDDEPLFFSSTRGLSNQLTGNVVSVSFREGLLLAIKTGAN